MLVTIYTYESVSQIRSARNRREQIDNLPHAERGVTASIVRRVVDI